MAGMFAGGALLMGILTASGGKDGLRELLRGMGEAVTVASAAFLHELGHILAAWGWGIPLRGLRLDLFGARMELGGLLSYRAELAVAAGGPFVSLAAAALVRPLGCFLGGAYLFSAVSLGLGLINLLPVRSMDGGRMLFCALSLLFGERVADVTLRVTTGLFLGGLWLLSVYCLLRLGETLTLFTFALCLLIRLLGGDRP
jgi:stage IV sporulation protein FB